MRFELTKEYIDSLRDIIERKDENAAIVMMANLHPADIAEIYYELEPDEAKFLYMLLQGEKASDVLAELEEDERNRFLEALPSSVIAKQFIDNMDSDDAADILGELSDEKQAEVLAHIEDIQQAGDIVDLLNYDEDTAGGLMDKEFISVNFNLDINTCIEEIRRQAEEVSEIYYIYVVDDSNVLKGTLSLKKLLVTPGNEKISTICEQDIISVDVDMESEEVVNIMDKYDLVSLPVVDSIGRLLGRITIDDVVDVMREEADKDYQMMSGLTEDVEPSDSIWQLTRARIPWLLIGLLGGIGSSKVIGHFGDFIQKNAVLAIYIPLIGAMGGNVGVQSASIVVKALATNSFGLESNFRKIVKEFSVALINAIVCSVILAVYNLVSGVDAGLVLTVSSALLIVIILASMLGTFIPLILDKLKIDPALATGPFITTSNDIIGLVVYFMIGSLLFKFIAG